VSGSATLTDRRVEGTPSPIEDRAAKHPAAGAALVCQAPVGRAHCHGLSMAGSRQRRRNCLAIREVMQKASLHRRVNSSGARTGERWMRSPLAPFVDPLPAAAPPLASGARRENSCRMARASHSFTATCPSSGSGATAEIVQGTTIEASAAAGAGSKWIQRKSRALPVVVKGAEERKGADGVKVEGSLCVGSGSSAGG